MNSLKLNKIELRKTCLEKVKEVTDRSKRSFLMKDTLLPILNKYQHIALFASLDNEIDTFPLMEELLRQGKNIYLPRVCGSDIYFYQVDNLNNLAVSKDKYHIREPRGDNPISKEILDVVVTPGVAFDKSGNRLGHGKGFYDRFLIDIKAYKIGVCYKEQLVEEVPVDNHDIKTDKIYAF